MITRLIILLSIGFVNLFYSQASLEISSCGTSLKNYYLNLGVEQKWQSGQHIDWLTGLPDNPNATTGIRTHCSAFVAAACYKQNIYILRPPQHRQELLANAQYDWLTSSQSKTFGWEPIVGNVLEESQKKANDGYFVVIAAKNDDRHKPGHIALVMPAEISAEKLKESGPVLIQASTKNSANLSVKYSFRHHISDWNQPTENLIFYYNRQKFCTKN